MQYADKIVKDYLTYQTVGSTQPSPFGDYQDPTYMGFYFWIDPNSTINSSDLVEDAYESYSEGLFRPEEDPNSAAAYLRARGESKRADMIVEFREKFLDLVNNYPWYIQSVSGVADLWKFDPKNNYRVKEKKLTFTTLESIDLKITYLLDLYRKAVYDTQYMRYMVPEPQRLFNAKIVIAEVRNIHVLGTASEAQTPADESLTDRFPENPLLKAAEAIGIPATKIAESFPGPAVWNDPKKALKDLLFGKDRSTGYPLTLRSFDELATFISFDLGSCEFSVFDEAPKFLETLTVNAEAQAENGFSIVPHYIKESNTYGLLGAVLRETKYRQDRTADSSKILVPKNGEKLAPRSQDISEYVVKTRKESYFGANERQKKRQQEIKLANPGQGGLLDKVANNLADKALAEVTNKLGNIVKGALLGNVYGFSAATVLADPLGAARRALTEVTSEGVANAVLGNVSLQSPLLSTTVSPAKVGESPTAFSDYADTASQNLTSSNLGATSGDTDGGNNAIFTVKGIQASANLEGNPGAVPLIGPSSSPALPANVPLEGTGSINGVPGQVTLEGSGSIAGSPANVPLEGSGSINGTPGKTELTGDGELEGAPGSTELTGTGSITGTPGKEELVSNGSVIEGNPGKEQLNDNGAVIEGNPGKEQLIGSGDIEGNPGKTQLTGQGTIEGSTGKTIFDSPNIKLEGNPGETQLTGDAKLEGNPGATTLTGQGSFEGNPGGVELEGSAKLEGEPGKVNLTGEGSINGSLQKVNLTGEGSITGETGKVNLVGPAVSESKGGRVELEGEGTLSGKPGSVKLSDNGAKLEGYLGQERLTGEAKFIERNIGEVDLEGDARLVKEIGKVRLDSPDVQLEGSIGKEILKAPKISDDVPAKEELIAPLVSKVNLNDTNANLSGPRTTIEGESENANLSGPNVPLVRENLGNSNPKLNPNNEE